MSDNAPLSALAAIETASVLSAALRSKASYEWRVTRPGLCPTLPRTGLLARLVLASLGSLAPNWIAKTLLAAAPERPQLTLKLHAQPGLCLQHNHQRQIPWTNPALPPGKPLPPLNPASLATKTEQRRSHPQRRHRQGKRIGHFGPNPCLEPSALDRTRL